MPATKTGPRETSPQAAKAGPWLGLAAIFVILVTGFLLSWHSLGDLDIWFHLRAGRDVLAGQGIPAANTYSFTEPDHPWVNHEWLFQMVAVATGPRGPSQDLATSVAGWNVLRAVLTLILLGVILAGDRLPARLLGREGPVWASWSGIPVLAGLLLIWTRLTLRPELFSYVFLILLVRNLGSFFRRGDPSPNGQTKPWTGFLDPRTPGGRVFLITLVWAQFHGFSSLAPMLTLAAWILALLFPTQAGNGQRKGMARGAILLGLTVLALALTPNGPRGLLMPLKAVTQFQQTEVDLRTTVSELAPLLESPDSLHLTITMYLASLAAGCLWIIATLGRIAPLRVLFFLLAAAAAWTNQRSIGIFALAFILLFTDAPARFWRWPRPRVLSRIPHRATTGAGLALLFLTAAVLWPQVVRDDFYLKEGVGRRFGSGVNPARFPVAAAATMAPLATTPFFANLDAAAFMLAHTGSPIFIDGRTEAYSTGLWAAYGDIKRGDEAAVARLSEFGAEMVCLATAGGSFNQLAIRLLASPAWRLQGAEDSGLLFRRGDEAQTTSATVEILEIAGRLALEAGESFSATRRADQCLAAGGLFMLTGNDNAVEAAYRQGLTHRGDHPALNHNLGNLLLARSEYAKAFDLFAAALAVNPRLAGSALNAGVCRLRLGDPAEAARLFRRATGIDPSKFEAWVNLAVAHRENGDHAAAVAALERALELRPNDRRLRGLLTEWKRGAGS